MTQLFGTDGIRGTAGTFPLDVRTVRRVGAALVKALPASGAKLLIGRDTRESGEWIERELAHGARLSGSSVQTIGVAPTPAIAYLTGSLDFDAGVVISASHNPYQDNGIKVFSGAGVKYTEDFERRIEKLVADASWDVPAGEALGSSNDAPSAKVSGSRPHRVAESRNARTGAHRRRLRQRSDDDGCTGIVQGAWLRCQRDRG